MGFHILYCLGFLKLLLYCTLDVRLAYSGDRKVINKKLYTNSEVGGCHGCFVSIASIKCKKTFLEGCRDGSARNKIVITRVVHCEQLIMI